MSERNARPVWLCTVDLDRPLGDVTAPARAAGGGYDRARILVRLHGRPLGEVETALVHGQVGADALTALLRDAVGAEVVAHLHEDGLPPAALDQHGLAPVTDPPCSWPRRLDRTGAGRPLVSVVLATYRRPERLLRTLRTIAAQTYDALEVLVVDNAPEPGTQDAIDALADPRFRLLAEPAGGASRARNTGLRAARGEIIVVTDDDVDADPDWVGNLVTPFYEDARVACVTGLILPARLDTAAELLIEQFGGFSKGYQPRTFTAADTGHGPLYPYNAGLFGSGANAAFRRAPFLAVGGFPEDLGPATPARGGEDLHGYLSLLLAGHVHRYEPAAVVRHEHRADDAQIGRQVYSYGIGISAMITKRVLASAAERKAVLRALPAAIRYVLARDSAKNAGKTTDYPRRLTAYELAGLAYGPVAYLRSRAQARRAASEL
jgi:glycosyltransferase involved in cell wall biosynthesis